MTKREMFVTLREIVSDNAEMVDFIDHEIMLLDKKSSSPRKPSKVQLENTSLKEDIVAYLQNVAMPKCIKELQSEIPSLSELSNQRITHLLTDLVKSEVLSKEYVKKTPYYSAV